MPKKKPIMLTITDFFFIFNHFSKEEHLVFLYKNNFSGYNITITKEKVNTYPPPMMPRWARPNKFDIDLFGLLCYHYCKIIGGIHIMNQKIKQFLAILALLLIMVLIGIVIFYALTGNPDFWGFFGMILTLPLMIAGIAILIRLFR